MRPPPPFQLPQLALIGAACALGAPAPLAHDGPAEGPPALAAGGLLETLRGAGLAARWADMLSPAEPLPSPCAPLAERLAASGTFLARLADSVAAAIARGGFPLVLGGDHAIAAGTWRGVGRAHGPLGLIWVDAHLDAHTPATSWTGNIHGMPLAALLGEGDPALAAIPGPDLDPTRLAILGVRSWEPEEHALLERRGARIFFIEEVRARGLAATMAEAIAHARGAGRPFGVSIDLDSMDPGAIPGTTCPVPDGLVPAELAAALRQLCGEADLAALEIVEYVPSRDPDGSSARWLAHLILAALADAPAYRAALEAAGAA